jgi:DNA-binding beta-propeller fold protein YncE
VRTVHLSRVLVGAVLATVVWTSQALAITIDITTKDPSLVGESFSFSATATETTGAVQYRWSFGDDTKTDFTVGQSQVDHVFAKPGHYTIAVTVKDDSGNFSGETLTHLVHYPVTEKRPSASSSIVYDAARNRVYNVNQDNDTISAIDPMTMMKTNELAVYEDPEALALAPDGKLWVVHKDDYAIAIVNPESFQIERGFRLPYASQPIGLVMSPSGDAAYVTLMATGKLLKLNPMTGDVLGELAVGQSPRGVSVSADGSQVFVTRFVSPLTGGEVTLVDAATLTTKNVFQLTPDTTTMDTDQRGRGLPNFLFSVGLSPDAREAWISGKKDDIFRGLARDGLKLTQDNTVRPMVSVLDLSQTTELQANRIDLDDRDLPTYVEFSALGDYAFVTVTGSNLIEVRDAYTKGFITALTDAGLAPRGTVLGPMGRLFVQGSMERSVVVYDVSTVLDSSDIRSIKLKDIPVVAQEKLAADVLLGKQVFSNSADGRMTIQGYLTCITCHFDGGDDGQVYDFTSRGEGFRNTISLRGHRGMGQGNLLWSGAFDEVQDFEEEIRGLFLGHGFIADDALAKGTTAQALGDPKKGLSKELDAVATYLTTLDHVNPSPFRNPDGSMTADAVAGKALFGKLGCDFCHAGKDFTDSARGRLHDVGTLKASSGTRDGSPLLGLDTPSLLGAWETAPYLHDGSAATLRDVLTTQNPDDQHGFTSSLSAQQLDQLVAYLQQIDGDQKLRALPFEPPLPEEGGAGGASNDAGAGTGAEPTPMAGTGGSMAAGGTPGSGGSGVISPPTKKHESSCALGNGNANGDAHAAWWLLLTPALAWYRRRRRGGSAGGLR